MKQNKILLNIFVFTMVFVLMAFSVSAGYPELPVDLGTAGKFVALAETGVSTTGTTAVTGDVGVSPIDSTAITGFGLIMDSSNVFSTSSLVTGKVYAADYTPPTPIKMGIAIGDMLAAYSGAAGRITPTATELGAGDISAMTLAPGLYKWGTNVLIDNRGVTLSGSSTDVWIFQISGDLTLASTAIVSLSGGAQASNVFWQVAGPTGVEIGTTAHVEGNILAAKAIHLRTGATLNGRALAQSAVTLDANTITAPIIVVTPVLTKINLLPTSANLTVGLTTQLNATSLDQFGMPFAATILYNSSNVSVATVDVNGLFTAISVGNVNITAYSGNVSNVSKMTVKAAPVLTTIVLLPTAANITVGFTQQLSATGRDQYGASIAAAISYTSNDTTVATVDVNGLITAVSAGNFSILVASGTVNTTNVFTVKVVDPTAPILNPIGSKTVTQGTLLNFVITATSPTGLNLTYAISGKPSTANFTDNNDTTATFSWIPDVSNIGVSSIKFTVSDGTKTTSETILLTVNNISIVPPAPVEVPVEVVAPSHSSNGGGYIDTTVCGDWSTCNSDGTQTQMCTYPNSNTTLKKEQSCTPVVESPVVSTVPTTDNNNVVTPVVTPTTPADNNVVTPNNGNNLITGQVIGQNNGGSWWTRFWAWLSRLFGGK